jgi:hypothetical protein
MATVTKSQGKTSFVKQFLNDNPEGTSKTVNEAWQAAGFDGTISHPIISEVRKQLGLTGNQPEKTRKAAKGKSAPSLRKAVARDQGKTSFVTEFLRSNPQGNVQAVNEAWTKSGKDGSIGSTLIFKMRSQMGLSGNLRTASKPKTAAKGKAAAKNSRTAAATPAKSMFVKEFLNDHPEGNGNDVNVAWTAAGFEGTISRTLVDKTRALLGLTGNLSGKSKTKAKTTPTGKKLGRPRKDTTTVVNGQPRGRKSNRSLALDELEADIDRLIFKVMGVGDLTQIEETLRQTRRLLYGALTRG